MCSLIWVLDLMTRLINFIPFNGCFLARETVDMGPYSESSFIDESASKSGL